MDEELNFWDPLDRPKLVIRGSQSGPPCLKCGGRTTIRREEPPRHARIVCVQCHKWRWLPRTPKERLKP